MFQDQSSSCSRSSLGSLSFIWAISIYMELYERNISLGFLFGVLQSGNRSVLFKQFIDLMNIFLTQPPMQPLHFQEVKRSLGFLRKDERFCDLIFVCHAPNSAEASKPKKPKRVFAHTAVIQPHSKLIKTLVDISREKQVIIWPGTSVWGEI